MSVRDHFAAGSFRDPHARLSLRSGRLTRTLDPVGAADYSQAVATGVLPQLIEHGSVVETWATATDEDVTIESRIIPGVVYPAEWSFSMLQDAAVLTLDITDAALAAGMQLKDASAFNVVFDGCRPVFVDIGSFEDDYSGFWPGYGQFVDHFLMPLMLAAYRDIPIASVLRSSLDGASVTDYAGAFRLLDSFRPGVFKHVRLRSATERRAKSYGKEKRSELRTGTRLPREVVAANVRSMRKLVGRLNVNYRSEWVDYSDDTPYTEATETEKARLVEALAAASGGGALAWDVGANDGTYTEILARHFDRVIAMDGDAGAIDRLYRRLRATEVGGRITPAVVDITDPPAGRGWANRERPGLYERSSPDLASWLAIVHHLSITAGVPLPMVVDQIYATSPMAIVEWIDVSDPQVELLLAGYRERDRTYSREVFVEAILAGGEILRQERVNATRSLLLVRRT